MAASGELTGLTSEQVGKVFSDLTDDPKRVIIWHSVFMAITILIVARGLNAGIETVSKILMPLFFLMLLVTVGYAAYIGLRDCGAGQVCGFNQAIDFLFVPDWSELKYSSVLAAVGQAFFSVGVGVAIMLTYGSYLSKQANIPANGTVIAFSDTLVALLAGLAIFPIVFAIGAEPNQGPGLLFVTLPYSLGQMPASAIFGTMFFTLGFFAALTSSISMLEITTAWAKEQRNIPRPVAAIAFGVFAWIIGLGSALSTNLWSDVYPLSFIPALKEKGVLDALDWVTGNFTMPLGGLLIALLAGWVIRRQIVREELRLPGLVLLLWRILVQFLVPLALVFLMLTGLGIMTFTDTSVCFDVEFAKACVDL
jgi:NSS family neurotransmitter:Na+ symporter